MQERPAALVSRLGEAGGRRGEWEHAREFAAAMAVLDRDYPAAAGAAAEPDALARLAEVFGLDELDATLLVCACAPSLDVNVALAFGYLRGLTGVAGASVGIALELAGIGTAQPGAFERLGPGGPLRRQRLVEVTGTEPWPLRPLVPADPVVAALAGARPADPAVSPMLCDPEPLPGGSDQVARAIGGGAGLVWIRSGPRAEGASLATGSLQALGLRWLAVDARRAPAGVPIAEAMSAAGRLAGLVGAALVVVGADAVAEADTARAAFAALQGAAVPVIAAGRAAWNPDWLAETPLVVEATPPAVEAREAMWRASAIGPVVAADDRLRQALLGLRMSPDDIAETARYARMLAVTRGERATDVASVRAAVRRIGGARGASNDRVEAGDPDGSGPGFDDLVLPGHVTDELRRLVSWGRHRDRVHAHGPLHRGRGITALFAGNPGTGKTLAAHVVAEELSMELFQVELSAVVDKYIGETEKHLERVFEAAEALDVVLFFDEADALFGSRSEVRDARDRYANQEIAYLLQRMERFEGVTILATNLRGNLDRAFSRRMSFIVNFPDPDPAIRRELWRHHLDQLPGTDPGDPIDVGYLADAAELAGGDIRNIVLAAAYDAAGAGEAVGMRHVVAATVREYHKLGRVLPEHRFAGPVRG